MLQVLLKLLLLKLLLKLLKKLEKLQLSGVAPSGQYELKFALQVVASHSHSRNVPPLHCRSSPASPHTCRTTTR